MRHFNGQLPYEARLTTYTSCV